MPEQRKGSNTQPGQGEQLPQGGAAALNEAAPTDAALQQAGGAPSPEVLNQAVNDFMAERSQGPPDDVQFAPPGGGGAIAPRNENEEILFADSTGRGLDPAGVNIARNKRLPSSVTRYLPMMAQVQADPGAPQSLKLLYRALVNRLEEELRA